MMRLGAIAMWTHGRLAGSGAELADARHHRRRHRHAQAAAGRPVRGDQGRAGGWPRLSRRCRRARRRRRAGDAQGRQRAAAGAGERHRAGAGRPGQCGARAARRVRGRHHRLQRQDHGEDAGGVDPVAPRPHPRQRGQPQQRTGPAADPAGDAAGHRIRRAGNGRGQAGRHRVSGCHRPARYRPRHAHRAGASCAHGQHRGRGRDQGCAVSGVAGRWHRDHQRR